MVRLFLLISAALTILAFHSAFAQTYVLNPYHEKNTPSSLPLSSIDAEKWLQTFYKKVPLLVTLDRNLIKDENGESLDQKIKLATQNYLELRHDQAQESSQEALNLLSQN